MMKQLLNLALLMVLTAALHNAGLMIFVILGAGSLYQYLGGAIPVHGLDLGTGMLLLVLVVAICRWLFTFFTFSHV